MTVLWLYGHGAMGRLHAEKLTSRPNVEVKIIDPALGYVEPQGIPDGVIVATPAKTHAHIASKHLKAGRYCLVEKPLSNQIDTARELASYPTLCVAFIERFQNIWKTALSFQPRFIQAERISPFTGRGTDVDVILDMMIHDIDHCLELKGECPMEISAIGVAAKTKRYDMVNARLTFKDGSIAQLSASRVSSKAERKMRLFSDGDYLSLNFQSQDMHRIQWVSDKITPLSINKQKEDPLTRMHDAFLATVNGEAPFPIKPNAGLNAMEVAMSIREALC